MAIFERRAWGKVIVDDTQALKITFEGTHNVQGHTEYVIRVQRGPYPDSTWHVSKRYNDFFALHNAVVVPAGVQLVLPKKRLLGNMDHQFIAERRTALESYLKGLLMNPILASSLGVRRFLDPETYALSLQEQAAHHVAMALRSEVNYELIKPLPEMGWRLRKHYFLVKAKLNPRTEMALQWVEYGPDKVLEERDLQAVLKLLSQVVHQHIQPLELGQCCDAGSFIVRPLFADGSLRDYLCCTKPKSGFLQKYGSPKETRALSLGEVEQYGRQILSALIWLKDRGIPYGHLHAGNVIIVDGQVRLLDIENGVLGLPSYYRPFFVQHKKVCSLEAIDVYCFGHVIYEMAMGCPLMTSVCDNLPTACPTALREVIELILSPESLRSRLPTLSELQQLPFFGSSGVVNKGSGARMTNNLKESLKSAAAATERRLHAEQKLVRAQKKIAKVQELLTSDDEIRRRKERLGEERKANHANANVANKKSPPRSDSPSNSTATSAGTVTPPPLPPEVRSAPTSKQASVTSPMSETGEGRSALLNSICGFDKAKLKSKSASLS